MENEESKQDKDQSGSCKAKRNRKKNEQKNRKKELRMNMSGPGVDGMGVISNTMNANEMKEFHAAVAGMSLEGLRGRRSATELE